ncbi:MAG: DUF2919 family protein [Hydrogenophilales bacterium]|nr:DUF2919 family protein [Hydrogenophilales bacterium]
MTTQERYPAHCYSDNLCLKVPLLLVLAMLFSVRHLFIVFLAYNPSPKMAASFTYLQAFQSPWFVFSDLPALLVLIAWLKRLPESGVFWRGVWKRGRLLLTISLLIQFALLLWQQGQGLYQAYSFTDSQRFVIVNLGLDLLMIYYLWRFAIVGDVFADFPKAKAPDATS